MTTTNEPQPGPAPTFEQLSPPPPTSNPSSVHRMNLDQFQWSEQVEKPIEYGPKEQPENLEPTSPEDLARQTDRILSNVNSTTTILMRQLEQALRNRKTPSGLSHEYASVAVAVSKVFSDSDHESDRHPLAVEAIKSLAFHLHNDSSLKNWSARITPTSRDVVPDFIKSIKESSYWNGASEHIKGKAINLSFAVAIGSGNLKTAIQLLDSAPQLGLSDQQISDIFNQAHAGGLFDHALSTYPTIAEGVIASLGEGDFGATIKDRPEVAQLKTRAERRILERKRVEVARFDGAQTIAPIAERERTISPESMVELAKNEPNETAQLAEVDNRVDRLVRGKAGNVLAVKIARTFRGDLPFDDTDYLQMTKVLALAGKSSQGIFPDVSGFRQFDSENGGDMADSLRHQQHVPQLYIRWPEAGIPGRFEKGGGLYELMAQMVQREDDYFANLNTRSGGEEQAQVILQNHQELVLFLSAVAEIPALEEVIKNEFGFQAFDRIKAREMREAIDRSCRTNTQARFDEIRAGTPDLHRLAELVASETEAKKIGASEALITARQRVVEERTASVHEAVIQEAIQANSQSDSHGGSGQITETGTGATDNPVGTPVEKKPLWKRLLGK